MRRGAENEEWDRLAWHLVHLAKVHGAKRAKLDDFHKFRMPDNSLNKEKLRNLKGVFGG